MEKTMIKTHNFKITVLHSFDIMYRYYWIPGVHSFDIGLRASKCSIHKSAQHWIFNPPPPVKIGLFIYPHPHLSMCTSKGEKITDQTYIFFMNNLFIYVAYLPILL